ncbi:MAG: FecR domain-containing protein [Alphaproteobacteria bacterium]|nr:FecR domain-containing protein [Alphaproteobacteria bacterium]
MTGTAKSFALALLGAAALVTPASAEEVGEFTKVLLYAYQKPPGGEQAAAYALDPVIRNASVSAVRDGGAELRFLDGSTLTVGPESEVVIDEFVYDPAANAGSATMRLTKGVFRYVSGRMPDDKVQIETETATIGIRGTVVTGGEVFEGGEVVNCVEGACAVTSKTTGQTAEMTAFTFVRIDEDGALGPVTPGLWWLGEPVIDAGVGFGGDSGGNDTDAPDISTQDEGEGEGGGDY